MAQTDLLSPLVDEVLLLIIAQCDPTTATALTYTSRRFYHIADPHPLANRRMLTLMLLNDNIKREREALTTAKSLEQRLDKLDIRLVHKLSLRWVNTLLATPFTGRDIPRENLWQFKWGATTTFNGGSTDEAPEWWPDVGPREQNPTKTIAEQQDAKARLFCLRLLRLHASFEDVKRWRGGRKAAAEMFELQNQGWTAFVRALAPPKKTFKSMEIVVDSLEFAVLGQVYDIAALDEGLSKGETSEDFCKDVLLELDRQLTMSTIAFERVNHVLGAPSISRGWRFVCT